MPVTIEWEKRGICYSYRDTLTGSEMIDITNETYSDPRFDDIRYQLVDLLAVTGFELSIRDVERRSALDRAAARSNPNIIVAIVAYEEALAAMASLYGVEILDSPWDMRIFQDLKTAREWISDR
ncbi:MAG: hypothetical protein GY835_26430 [bacterium]|nr:hypothetical protein [bacterium]